MDSTSPTTLAVTTPLRLPRPLPTVRTPALRPGSQVMQIEEVSEGKALAPSFLKVPTDTEVQEGKLVRLECRTAGKPAPDVSPAGLCILSSADLII